jgi:hypothetical protein
VISRERRCGEKFCTEELKTLRGDPVAMHACMARMTKCESLCARFARFDRKHHGAAPQIARLWKNFLTWVKPTQCRRFTILFAFNKRSFRCAGETEIEFPICAKTSIPSVFPLRRKIRALALAHLAHRRFAPCRSAALSEQSKTDSGVAYTVR